MKLDPDAIGLQSPELIPKLIDAALDPVELILSSRPHPSLTEKMRLVRLVRPYLEAAPAVTRAVYLNAAEAVLGPLNAVSRKSPEKAPPPPAPPLEHLVLAAALAGGWDIPPEVADFLPDGLRDPAALPPAVEASVRLLAAAIDDPVALWRDAGRAYIKRRAKERTRILMDALRENPDDRGIRAAILDLAQKAENIIKR